MHLATRRPADNDKKDNTSAELHKSRVALPSPSTFTILTMQFNNGFGSFMSFSTESRPNLVTFGHQHHPGGARWRTHTHNGLSIPTNLMTANWWPLDIESLENDAWRMDGSIDHKERFVLLLDEGNTLVTFREMLNYSTFDLSKYIDQPNQNGGEVEKATTSRYVKLEADSDSSQSTRLLSSRRLWSIVTRRRIDHFQNGLQKIKRKARMMRYRLWPLYSGYRPLMDA